MHVWKNNTDGQSLPRVGKVANAASRIGFWRHENQWNEIDNAYVSSTPLTKVPYPPLRGTFP